MEEEVKVVETESVEEINPAEEVESVEVADEELPTKEVESVEEGATEEVAE